MPTRIIALGTGSAFTMNNYQTNFVIKRNGKYLLVDCGGDVRFSLRDQGLSAKDIDAVYISHAHADHVGGMEFLAFTRYFTKRSMENARALARTVDPEHSPEPLQLPVLFCEHGMIRTLWDHSLRGGLEGLEGIDANIDTYFRVHPVPKNGSFEWEGLKFDIVQSLHVSAKYSIVDSFGLMFTDDIGYRIFITTDVQFAPETSMKAYYKEADVIIHDCETGFKSGVHAHYDQLRTLDNSIKNKMLLVHYQDNVLEDWNAWVDKANQDGFDGFVKPGPIWSDEPPDVIAATTNV
jgi:ribonuclease BN (tRNA processing enzyme)